ncbi:hypothetical protein [Novosphingobium sp. Gsoil 351]|uniref:hypothetical protein n=1 Tax=Novosphingobium sp. Gsoil 351 TaxID=2675225 RepID=UPI0012B4F5DE|nr:hypothetical protein [Novosphingobium sp. Gsoil 351]QGN54167.1 hypothetical protein GKE62_06025 [Novosphingobium sp. Gsoil 351]
MNIPTLNSDGRVDRPPHLFVNAIETSLERRVADMRVDASQLSILTSASTLAAEVFAAGIEWEPVSRRFSQAAVDHGIPAEVIGRHLALAEEYASFRLTWWIEMCREWIRVVEGGFFYNLATRRAVDANDFILLFRDIAESERAAAIFLLHLVYVEQLIFDASLARGFHEVDGMLAFNELS